MSQKKKRAKSGLPHVYMIHEADQICFVGLPMNPRARLVSKASCRNIISIHNHTVALAGNVLFPSRIRSRSKACKGASRLGLNKVERFYPTTNLSN